MGPLQGVRVLEIAGIGPGPFCAMMLADMGADVIRIDRAASAAGASAESARYDVMGRGRRSIAVDLKSPEGVEVVLSLVEKSDVLLEGFRPGVAERLGIGPDDCQRRNPRLVYGRMTGWGQDGPNAHTAGHDITYLATAGALHPLGRQGQAPVPPINLLGDFGGGGMYLAFGIACALFESRGTGTGQVIDASIVDGAASLMAMIRGFHARGFWRDERGVNMLDTGAPYYDVYECADGGYLAVGAIEPKFYARLAEGLGLSDEEAMPEGRNDPENWPAIRERIAAAIRSKPRDEWAEIFRGGDACAAPVLSMTESTRNEHMRAREAFVEVDGVVQPAPAPRFSRTAPDKPSAPPPAGAHTAEVLAEYGFTEQQVSGLVDSGAVAEPGSPAAG